MTPICCSTVNFVCFLVEAFHISILSTAEWTAAVQFSKSTFTN